MAKKYRVKSFSLQLYPTLTTQLDGVGVALGPKEITYPRMVDPLSPPVTMTAKPATQAQLRVLFESGNPHIEEYEDGPAEPTPAAKP
jgi:hypothetical protein